MTPTLTAEQIGELEAMLAKASPGKWEVQDSNSWRRIGVRGEQDGGVICPIKQRDGHPDLHARREDLDLVCLLKNAAPALIAMAKHSIKMDEGACADQGALTNAIGRAEAVEVELTVLREEVFFWRGDLAARLALAVGIHKHAVKTGDAARAADIRVSIIMPGLAALRDADAKEWHGRCDFCGEFIRPEDEQQASGYEDVGPVHRRCGNPDELGFPEGPGWQEKAIADARAIVGIKP